MEAKNISCDCGHSECQDKITIERVGDRVVVTLYHSPYPVQSVVMYMNTAELLIDYLSEVLKEG